MDRRELELIMPEPIPEQAADYFGAMAERYDAMIRRAVPRYDEMTEQLLAYLPERVGEARAVTRILELGCGTGNLTLRLAAKYPGARITAVDAAEEMTRLTAERGSRLGPRVPIRTITARFEELELPTGGFDLVTSCLSLHHVRDKAPLYRKIFDWLDAGGVLCFADQLLGVTERVQGLHWAAWEEFSRGQGRCTEEEFRSWEEHAATHDHYEPLLSHLRYLAEAGFVNEDVAWRYRMYTAVTAEKRG